MTIIWIDCQHMILLEGDYDGFSVQFVEVPDIQELPDSLNPPFLCEGETKWQQPQTLP